MDTLKLRAELVNTMHQLLEHRESINKHVRQEIYNSVSDFIFEFLGFQHPAFNVKSIPLSKIKTNDYNPNKMASPEFKLLKRSLEIDGMTMPIVVTRPDRDGFHTVIDGAHRFEIFKKSTELFNSTAGNIPVAILEKPFDARISSTVRHNIARGVHQVELTAKLVVELKGMNWSNEKIALELGMDADEVLRMQQITGLAEAFKDDEFSSSWT